MGIEKPRQLDPNYTAEVDTLDEQAWCQTMQQFDDANIYQTWEYAAVIAGKRNVSQVVLRHNGEIVAIALARIAKLPLIRLGVAYVQWGPLWRRAGTSTNVNTLRQALRALRNEFVCRRGLVLRLFPLLFNDDSPWCSPVLEEEGYVSLGQGLSSRTILMDLSPQLQDLHSALGRNWKRNLKEAEQSGLEVVENSGIESFDTFTGMYEEMVSRKKFLEPNNIKQFRTMQTQLPDKLKMGIMLCRSGNDVCAGLIWSAMGNRGIELFAATSDAGTNIKGASHLLRWKLVQKLKEAHITNYDLNGINPVKNPGSYRFKTDLAGKNGKDVTYLGRFDSHGSLPRYLCIQGGDRLRSSYRSMRESLRGARRKLTPNQVTAG